MAGLGKRAIRGARSSQAVIRLNACIARDMSGINLDRFELDVTRNKGWRPFRTYVKTRVAAHPARITASCEDASVARLISRRAYSLVPQAYISNFLQLGAGSEVGDSPLRQPRPIAISPLRTQILKRQDTVASSEVLVDATLSQSALVLRLLCLKQRRSVYDRK